MNTEVTYVPRSAVEDAAARYPTPFFLYEEERLRQNCRRFVGAFKKHFEDFSPLFAVKANPNPRLLRIIMEEGFGFDASSYAEAWLARRLGARGMYTGNYTLEEELRMASEAGLILNLDDISLLPVLERIGVPEMLSFRVNPGVGDGGMRSLILAGPDAKFGVPFEKAAEAYAQARDMGVKRFGIHMMTGSNVLNVGYFTSVVERLLDIVADIKRESGVEIELLNMGGGFGVPYDPYENSLDLDALAAGVKRVMDERCRAHGLQAPQLMAEPGRCIGATAGWLVARVTVVKDGYKKFVGIDANANDMPRPSIYGAFHYITALTDETARETVSVVGRICENNDQFARDRHLPRLKSGDVLAIHNCGAHAFAMGHNYNGHPRHAEFLLTADGAFEQIRRAETVEDLFDTVAL